AVALEALVLAAVGARVCAGGVAVAVVESREAAGDRAAPGHAPGLRARLVARDAARAAVERIGLEVEAVVDHAVTVVVDAVARLGVDLVGIAADHRAAVAGGR